MAPKLSPTVPPTPRADPRFQPGAYITDGEALYCVGRAAVTTSLRANIVAVEDCKTNTVLELDLARVVKTCKLVLVRQAPAP